MVYRGNGTRCVYNFNVSIALSLTKFNEVMTLRRVLISILLALSCIAFAALVSVGVNQKTQDSLMINNQVYSIERELQQKILLHYKLEELLKETTVTNDDLRAYRESLAPSESERENNLRRTYSNAMSYKTTAQQKKDLQQELKKALAYNKKIYNDDAFTKKIVLNIKKRQLKEAYHALEEANYSYDMAGITYNITNVQTGELISNEQEPQKAAFSKSYKNFVSDFNSDYLVGAYDENYNDVVHLSLMPENYKKYNVTWYLPVSEKEHTLLGEALQSQEDLAMFTRMIQIAGAITLIVAVILWVPIRNRYPRMTWPIDILALASMAILVAGLLLGGIASGIFNASSELNGRAYLTLAAVWTTAAFLIYWLLQFVHTIVYALHERNIRERLFIVKLARTLVQAFGTPQYTMFLLFSWFAFFLAGFGFLIIMEAGFSIDIFSIYIILWLIVMVPIMYIALKHIGSVNYVMDQTKEIALGNKNVVPLQGSTPLAKHSQRIQHLKTGVDESMAEKQKSERMKTELITNVSHDLRTPLTAMMTYTDLLKNPNLTADEHAKYVDVLDAKTQKLKLLIDDLFDVTKMASGQVELHKQTIDYVQLLQQLVGEQEELAAEHQLTIRTQLDAETYPITVDAAKWARMIDNLLGNAIKYSAANTRIHVQLKEGTLTIKNVSAYELSEDVDELVDRFKRGDASRHTEGSGLGLAIAQSIANLHGTHLTIQVDGDLFKVIVSL